MSEGRPVAVGTNVGDEAVTKTESDAFASHASWPSSAEPFVDLGGVLHENV